MRIKSCRYARATSRASASPNASAAASCSAGDSRRAARLATGAAPSESDGYAPAAEVEAAEKVAAEEEEEEEAEEEGVRTFRLMPPAEAGTSSCGVRRGGSGMRAVVTRGSRAA
eukprot:323095-Prymnesium_polylepis.1